MQWWRNGVAATLGLVAMVLALAPAAQATTTLSVAYIPIMPMAQLFVMEGEGWTKAAGLDLRLTKFDSGPAIVEAIASGRYDVMYFGIGPALVARAKGVPLKVVASNVIEQIGLVAEGDLAKAAAGGTAPADAIRLFAASHGRKPKIATLPAGSVPQIVLRYWLKHAGVPADSVDILGMGEDKVQQALLTRAVDAASILEPVVTIVRDAMPEARILVAGGDMFPKAPGAVVAVRESVLQANRDAILSLVRLHIRATEMLRQDPDRAAKDVEKFLGQGLVAPATIERALKSPLNNFVSDPREIVAATEEMDRFSREVGSLEGSVDVSSLFDLSVYEAAAVQK